MKIHRKKHKKKIKISETKEISFYISLFFFCVLFKDGWLEKIGGNGMSQVKWEAG